MPSSRPGDGTRPADPAFADPAFVARLRESDEDAIRRVVRTYLPHVLRAARGAGLAEDEARDLTQSAFQTFLEKLPTFEGRSHVRTWLFGILYRKLQERYRARKREAEHDDIDAVVDARFDDTGHWVRPPAPVELRAEAGDVRAHLEACLDGVPERQRSALLLRELQGFSSEEVCKILDVSRTNLGVLLFRARNRMRECLESKGVGSDG